MKALLGAVLALALAGTAHADGVGRGVDASDWLMRMQRSAQGLSYTGVYTFSHDGRIETSRIAHVYDSGSERGKVEALDGPPREVVRENNQIACYLPENRVVRLDRVEGRHFFPSLLSGAPASLREVYNILPAGIDRVAGRECQLVQLEPRDNLRYAMRLCADAETGLMLRAAVEDGARGVMQQFAFTEFDLLPQGGGTDRVRPSWSGEGWAWDRSGLSQDGDGAWAVSNPPAGFRKILDLRRRGDGRSGLMVHQVYSDGVAAISLFIEPARSSGSTMPSESRRGALSFYSLRVGDQQVTAIGEVPPLAVAQLARSAAPVRAHP